MAAAAAIPSALRLPFAFARRHGLLVRPHASGLVECVYRTPVAPAAMAEARRLLRVPMTYTPISTEEFDALLQKTYEAGNESMQAVEGLEGHTDLADLVQDLPEQADLLESSDDAPIIRLINAVLTQAVREGASDIHIEPFENRLVVRFRVDGVLREVLQSRRAVAPMVVSRIKVMSRLDIAEKRLPQDRAQPAREGHFHLGVDLGLADAVDVVLDRILDRHDVARVVVQALERGIERGRLARPGGAGDQQYAVRLVDQLVDQRLRRRIHAEAPEFEPPALFVEQPQHHALAMAGGDGRDAHVDRASGHAQADTPVLRQALLGDVESRHDFDARDHHRRHRAARLQHFAQHAVDAEAHHQAVLKGFDVDVRGALAHRLREHRVDQADDRRVIAALEQVGLFRQVLHQVGEVGMALESLDRLHRFVAGLIGLLQQCVEFFRTDRRVGHRHAQQAPRFGHRRRRYRRAVQAFDCALGL